MFGDNLKKFRIEKGFSQNDLAEKLFVTRQCVSKWEKGVTQPDLQTLSKLSELLNISIDVLIKDKENAQINRSEKLNTGFFIANIIIAIFCLSAFIALWRFLPKSIPAHWINGTITRYGNKNEVFLNLISVAVFLAIDVLVYLVLRRISDKKAIYISHPIIILFQVAYLSFIIAIYAKYLNNILSFIICLGIALIMCISIAMHPKISKQNYLLGVRISETLKSAAVWDKTNALACFMFSGWSLIIFITDLLWISKFNLLLFAGYLPLTIIIILYAKKSPQQ